MTTLKQLRKLREASEKYLQSWKAKGRPTAVYECSNCSESIETPAPAPNEVNETKPCWDSTKQCPHCGELNFVAVYPDRAVNHGVLA